MSELGEMSEGERDIKDKAIKRHSDIASSPLPERIRIRSKHALGKLIKDTRMIQRVAEKVRRSPPNLNPLEIITRK